MKWIPVTERLPDKEGDYFVIYTTGEKEVLYASGNGHEKRWKALVKEWLDESASLPSSSVTGEEEYEDEIYEIEDIDTIREMLIKQKKSSYQWCKKAMEAATHRIQLQQTIKELSVTGEWQLCPKCNGNGVLDIAQYSFATGVANFDCDVCNGKKILAKPVTGESEAIGERKFTLKEALDIWEAAEDWNYENTSEMVIEPTKLPNRQQYFKDKFGIDI